MKPAKTYHEQLAILKRRGLVVRDEERVREILAHHNYYRLSAYRFPFTVAGGPDQFAPGASFDDIWALYQFDQHLRDLLTEACKCVEISVRSRFAYEVGHWLSPLGYADAKNFLDSEVHAHAKTLDALDREMKRSKEAFIRHHRETLAMDLPPVWVVVEIASFGNISKLLSILKEPAIRQSIADTYLTDEKIFCSFVHHLSVVRNHAAHNARLWNRWFTPNFTLPRKKPANLYPNFQHAADDDAVPRAERRIYNTLVMLVHILRCVDSATTWPARIKAHLNALPPALIPHTGAPADWQTLPLWQQADSPSF